jgi:hypothetical protein
MKSYRPSRSNEKGGRCGVEPPGEKEMSTISIHYRDGREQIIALVDYCHLASATDSFIIKYLPCAPLVVSTKPLSTIEWVEVDPQ